MRNSTGPTQTFHRTTSFYRDSSWSGGRYMRPIGGNDKRSKKERVELRQSVMHSLYWMYTLWPTRQMNCCCSGEQTDLWSCASLKSVTQPGHCFTSAGLSASTSNPCNKAVWKKREGLVYRCHRIKQNLESYIFCICWNEAITHQWQTH